MDRYVFHDEISLSLVTNFILGYIIYVTLTVSFQKKKIAIGELIDWEYLQFIPFLLLGAGVLFVSVLIFSVFTSTSAGTLKDAINVSLAVSSILYPFQAINKRLLTLARGMLPSNGRQLAVVLISYLLMSIISLYMPFNYLRFVNLSYSRGWVQLLGIIGIYIIVASVIFFSWMQILKAKKNRASN